MFEDFLPEFLEKIERTRSKWDYRRAMQVLMKHDQAAEQLDWNKAEHFLNRVGSLEKVKSPTVAKWRSTYIKFWKDLGLNTAI